MNYLTNESRVKFQEKSGLSKDQTDELFQACLLYTKYIYNEDNCHNKDYLTYKIKQFHYNYMMEMKKRDRL